MQRSDGVFIVDPSNRLVSVGYNGFPKDIISKIGEPYLRSSSRLNKEKTGLGLGLFIGKTLLEKNFANVSCENSETRSGVEINIKWKNKDLFKL